MFRSFGEKFTLCFAVLLCLLLLMGCAAQPQGEEPEGPMEDTPQTLAIEGYETGVLPFLRVYRQAAEDGTWDYSYYVCTWEPHSGQLSQGELWQTEDGGLGRTRPASWQAQCVMNVNGSSFTYVKDGAEQKEELPRSELVTGAEVRCIALDGDVAVLCYYEGLMPDGDLTGVRVTAARYPLGQPENAVWVQTDITEGDVTALLMEKPVFWQGMLYLAAGDRLLAMDTENGQVTEPLDTAQLDALCPAGTAMSPNWGYQGLLIAGCCGDTLLINRILYEGENYHSITAAYSGGVLLGALEYRSADETMQLHLFDGALQEIAVSAIDETEELLYCFDLFPLRY